MKEHRMADKYISTAKVVDGTLILSLPDAVSPVVWQMELGQSKSSALEIRETDNGQFVLTLKTPRQDVLDIATYANRDLAIKALLVTSAALEKSQGQLKASPTSPVNGYPLPVVSHHPRLGAGFLSVFKKIFTISGIILGTLAFLGLVLFVVAKLFLTPPSTTATAPNGGPVSADEFLENR